MLEGIVFNMKENSTTQRFKRQREKGLSDTYSGRERRDFSTRMAGLVSDTHTDSSKIIGIKVVDTYMKSNGY